MNTSISTSNLDAITGYERLEDFLENATVGIHLVDKEGRIVYANRAELDMLGYSAGEYIGHNIKNFHADDSVINGILAKLLAKETLINHGARLKCKDGSVKDVLISSNVYAENGDFKHTRCFTRDITNLRKTEKLLRQLNIAGEELSASLNTEEALDKIVKFIVPQYADWFTIDLLKDGQQLSLKMAHADHQKIEWAKKYRGQNPIDLNDERRGSLGWVLRTGQPVMISNVTQEMMEASAKDEEHLEVIKALHIASAMVTPMLVKGKVIGVVCFISCNPFNKYDEQDFSFAKDFTNRITLTLENARLYEEVKQDALLRTEDSRRKDEFISIASHELKTPVTSLKAYTQVLEQSFEKKKDTKSAEMLAKMNKQIDKLTGLIVDLLDVTKITNGEIAFNIEQFDFNELVEETVEEMQRTTAHRLIVNLSKCTVAGDRNRLSQVLVNLLTNAIKYSPGAKKVLITSVCDEEKVTLCVKDFGIGISPSQQPKVFTRFYRANENANYTFPGLGLGLYISAEIIKRHGGGIHFESKPDKGSTFCFALPMQADRL
ncbi:MAG: ATP-binding protein [Ginsengibacter sp.]